MREHLPVAEERSFWFMLAIATAIALASPVLPRIVGSVDANWNVRVSYSLAAVWLVFLAVAVIRHWARGLWLLIGLPIVFKLLEYACRHNKDACL